MPFSESELRAVRMKAVQHLLDEVSSTDEVTKLLALEGHFQGELGYEVYWLASILVTDDKDEAEKLAAALRSGDQ